MKKEEKEEFCWNCTVKRPKEDFEDRNDYKKGMCKQCIAKQEQQLENYGLTVKEEDREPHYSNWRNKTIVLTNVYLIDRNDKEFSIRAYLKGELPYDTKVFGRINQFIHNDGHFITDYPGASPLSPFTLLAYMKENDYHFGELDHCELVKYKKADIWEFSGNLGEVSCAFCFRIYKKEYAERLAKCLEDWDNIEIELH